MGATVKVELSTAKVQSKVQAGATKAVAAVCEQIVNDINAQELVPVASGTLKDSVHTASSFKKGTITYNTPYAKKQYYTNPRKKKWIQVAVDTNRAVLNQVAQNAFNEGVKGK